MDLVAERITTVLLDAGETILHAEPSFWGVSRATFLESGIDVTPDQFDAAYLSAWMSWRDDGPFEASEEASLRRYRRLDALALEELGHAGLPESFFVGLEDAFRQMTSWAVFPDTVPALTSLRQAGLRLGVVSNWAWYGQDVVEALGLSDLVDVVTISARAGYSKPHPRIFHDTVERLRVEPTEVVHAGDSLLADVGGAQAAGLAAVLIDRAGAQAPGTAGDVPIIGDLLGLLDLLGIDRPSPGTGTAQARR